MPVSLKQIAREAGVSPQLVSAAMNGRGRIAPASRERILDIARRMGYNPFDNHAARTLSMARFGKPARSGVIGVVVGAEMIGLPYYRPLINGIEQEATKDDVDIFIGTVRGERVPRYIFNHAVDGVIVATASLPIFEAIRQAGLPKVALFFDPPAGESWRVIRADEREGTRLATHHLIELGHHRIAYIGLDPVNPANSERIEGYRHGLRESGRVVDEGMIRVDCTWVGSVPGMIDSLLANTPDITAIVCHNDDFAFTAIQTLQERGIRVPQDISVTGFDDTSLDFRFEPSVTSVAFDREHAGALAVRRLFASIEQESPQPSETDVMPVTLQVRESTAAPRHDSLRH